VSFSTLKNPRIEYITFDVVDMPYPYNAIFGRILLNTFEAALHTAYLYLKIPVTFDVIFFLGSQQEAETSRRALRQNTKTSTFCENNQTSAWLYLQQNTEKL
jgi:hypothetical protein